eukprot:2452061-Alexandrium_andersonii.AAC.1
MTVAHGPLNHHFNYLNALRNRKDTGVGHFACGHGDQILGEFSELLADVAWIPSPCTGELIRLAVEV